MRVLAIDTALEACAAAVLDTGRGALIAQESLAMQRGHAEALMPLIARVLSRARTAVADLDRIAVTVGPGSFTGLRVGIAAARGLALAAGKPAVGLTTLAAFAAPHIAADDSQTVASAIDARHDQVYLQIFGPGGSTVVAPCVVPVRDAARLASMASLTAKPRIVGTAATMIAAAWPGGDRSLINIDPRRAPAIDWVARLGAAATDTGTPPRPLYLRPPDAQPQPAATLARQ
jgi:tRNA threonylcarbamoyl adenosine modification protein YeaZ